MSEPQTALLDQYLAHIAGLIDGSIRYTRVALCTLIP